MAQLLDCYSIGEFEGVKVNEPANDVKRRNYQRTVVAEPTEHG